MEDNRLTQADIAATMKNYEEHLRKLPPVNFLALYNAIFDTYCEEKGEDPEKLRLLAAQLRRGGRR